MKLYIETVGCQMNELDSELVVARPAQKTGYELTASPPRRRHDPSSTPAASANTPKTRSTVPSAASKNAKTRTPGQSHRRSSAAWPKRIKASFSKRAPYVDLIVGPRPTPPGPRLGWARDSRRRWPADGSQPQPQRRHPAKQIERSHESFDPLRDPGHAAPRPYQAYVRIMIGCDKFCTYCIVPSVRGARAEPGRRNISSTSSRQLASEGCKRKSSSWAKPSTATNTAKATAPGV